MRVQKYIPISRSGLTFVVAILLAGFFANARAQLPGFTQAFDSNTSKISLSPSQKWGLFHRSDTVSVQTSDGSSVRVFDLGGTTVYQGPPGTLPSLPVGHYFVECPGDRNQFCVLPDDYVGASFLGADASNGEQTYSERLAQIQPAWVKTWALWSTIQPQSNVWDWSSLDAMVSANLGRKIIVVANYRPAWVEDSNFLSSFLTYVCQISQRYDGRIYAIQIWNEPWVETVSANGMAWGDIGNPVTGNMDIDIPVWENTLATLIASSGQAIRSISSSIKVFGPDWSNPTYVQESAALALNGGIGSLDTFTFHGWSFGTPDGAAMTNQDGYTRWIDLIKPYLGGKPWMISEFHAYGASALGIPNQPSNAIGLSGIDWHRGMCRIVKTVVMWQAKGAQAIYEHVLALYAEGSNPNYEIFGWEYASAGGRPRGPHPKTSAYLMSGYWLNNATFVDVRTPGQKVFLYAWRRADNTSLLFAWTAEGQTASLNASSFTTTDIWGHNIQVNTLTEEPVLFYSNSPDASALLSNVMASLSEYLNLSPVLSPISNQSVQKGALLQFPVSATDPDYDPLTYSASPLPAGASIDPVTGVFSWTPTAGQAGAYQLTFTATDARGLSTSTSTIINVLTDPLDGLANYWKFDEGTGSIASDSAGANSGTLVNFEFSGTSNWVDGKMGKALSFDGQDDYVSLDSASLNFTNNFSVAAWVNPRVASDANVVLALRDTYQQSGLSIWVHSNALIVEGQTTNGWHFAWFAPGAFTNNMWSHIAIVYDKGIVNAFVNGQSVPAAYGSLVDWDGDLVMDATKPSRIGAELTGYFSGVIDDVMIFNRTLSADEVRALYQDASSGPDSAPVITPIDAKSVQVGQTLGFTVSATGSAGDTLTYSATPLPLGAVLNAANGAFTWTPQTNQVGSYNVKFAVSDGLLSDSLTASITVTKSAGKLVLKPIKPKRVRASRRVNVKLSAKNPGHKPLTYSVDPIPAGSAFDSLRHKFVWVTTNASVGTYSLTASVTDGTGSDTQPVIITVY